MDKTQKGLIEFGIGVASIVVVEALGNTVKRLEKEGKLNKKEGEKMMNEALAKAKSASAKYAKEAQAHIDGIVKASPFATKADIDALNAKIDMLSKKAAPQTRKVMRKVGSMATKMVRKKSSKAKIRKMTRMATKK